MEDFTFKLDKSIKNFKNQNMSRRSIMSFNSEKDDYSINSIKNDSSIVPNISNSKNILINKSFHKKNKINFLNKEVNSKNNISEDYKINHSNNNNAQKQNSSSITLKSYSQLLSSKNNNFKNIKIFKKTLNQKIDNSNNFNENKNFISNNKVLALRNQTQNLNSGKISTVKEEQEQASDIIDNNNNNNNKLIDNIDLNKEKLKIQIFFEGKNIEIYLNKNDKFKKLVLLIQKELSPYYKITDYDILYNLNNIDIISSLNTKLLNLIGNLKNGNVPTFLLRKKEIKKEKNNNKGTIVKIEGFPSLTDLAIDLNYFFKKETSESDFVVENKNNICKVIFNSPEKAFSLVAFLSKLKTKKTIYKRLKVNLDYKINNNSNITNFKQNPGKIMLPYLKKEIINNLKNKNYDFFYIKSPKFKRKNIKLFLPNYFSFSQNVKNKSNKDEDIIFLYKNKSKQRENNANNGMKIISYTDKIKPNERVGEIKNKLKLSSLSNNRNKIKSPNLKRNSLFYNSLINFGIDNNKNNNDELLEKKNFKQPNKINDLMMRSCSKMDKLKSKMINNKNNIIKKEVIINSSNDNNIYNSKSIENNENIKINENKNDLDLIELLKTSKISDDSNDSSKENNSYEQEGNRNNNKKFSFKNKNKKFLFFNGLTKREKNKYLDYKGKKDV